MSETVKLTLRIQLESLDTLHASLIELRDRGLTKMQKDLDRSYDKLLYLYEEQTSELRRDYILNLWSKVECVRLKMDKRIEYVEALRQDTIKMMNDSH